MSNIILIGMPGSGKSTLGVLLAKALGYSFIDSDLIIQKQQDSKLQEIIERFGIEHFLECEERAILSIVEEKTVIATGGSAVLCSKGMEHLKSIGKVVYINLSPQAVAERIKNIKTRGIVMSEGESIEDIYRVRAPLYEHYADLVVDVQGASIEETIEKLLLLLNEAD